MWLHCKKQLYFKYFKLFQDKEDELSKQMSIILDMRNEKVGIGIFS